LIMLSLICAICGISSVHICGKNKKNFPQIFADFSADFR
jgi:hypothetical protein